MLLNLTPHTIVVRLSDGGEHVFSPFGQTARVQMMHEPVESSFPFPVVTRFASTIVEGLQYDEQGRILPCLVSSMVLDALPKGTQNVYAPDAGPTAIRENGQIVAVTRLIQKEGL
jgi:hypothetical protein